jgi:replicative DNA helicase
MFLFRPEYYLKNESVDDPVKWERAMDEARGKIEFIVAKRRRGCTGISHGRFFGAFQAVRG